MPRATDLASRGFRTPERSTPSVRSWASAPNSLALCTLLIITILSSSTYNVEAAFGARGVGHRCRTINVRGLPLSGLPSSSRSPVETAPRRLAAASQPTIEDGDRVTAPSRPRQDGILGRRAAFGPLLGLALLSANAYPAHAAPEQKLYSSNARNMARLSSGDQSAGSIYDNDPKNPAAAKRRAMVGCKIASSRKEAARIEGLAGVLSEKDCNLRVMGGDSEFMLKALRELDCPTCPYGVDGA